MLRNSLTLIHVLQNTIHIAKRYDSSQIILNLIFIWSHLVQLYSKKPDRNRPSTMCWDLILFD